MSAQPRSLKRIVRPVCRVVWPSGRISWCGIARAEKIAGKKLDRRHFYRIEENKSRTEVQRWQTGRYGCWLPLSCFQPNRPAEQRGSNNGGQP